MQNYVNNNIHAQYNLPTTLLYILVILLTGGDSVLEKKIQVRPWREICLCLYGFIRKRRRSEIYDCKQEETHMFLLDEFIR